MLLPSHLAMTSEQLHHNLEGFYPMQTLQPMECPDDGSDNFFNQDVYNGEPPRLSRPSTPSSSSSSSSSSTGGGLGALASVVEQAIARWARGARRSSASSSSSSSSSSSELSENTRRFSIHRRRRRRSNASSLHTNVSERDIAARITRMKALEESRQIPRQFILYLPPPFKHPQSSSCTARGHDDADYGSRKVIRTSSLSLVLDQLGESLKRTTRGRRLHGKFGVGTLPLHQSRKVTYKPQRQSVIMATESGSATPLQGSNIRKSDKGKHREGSNHLQYPQAASKAPRAWFLDVSSPTWGDLKAIGKLLHLHPLTLEDILQQDPREKLDLFQKLGYYFISFRAIETREDREKFQRQIHKMDGQLETVANHDGTVRETNVYLVVFNEGICCFHYNDIAEHTDRVRNRIALLEEVANMSADWIAHGILDSIVDSFFPYLENIEKEVMAIEELVFSANAAYTSITPPPQINVERSEKPQIFPLSETLSFSEKSSVGGSMRPHFAVPKWTLHLLSRCIRRFFKRVWQRMVNSPVATPTATTLTLRQMARTRRLVTSLGRLLASKSEVVAQIKKRLLKTGTSDRSVNAEELEVAMYMGDIQDHILTFQHSLNHYERMLSQSHPAYLSQLRATFASSKSGTDKSLFYLTSVSIAVICVQVVMGNFSMNINVPMDGTGYRVFGVVLSLAIIVLFIYVNIVRYWWKQAGKTRRALL